MSSRRLSTPSGEDEDWLFELAGEMEPEDGLSWVYGVGEDGIPAFSDDGIESLRASSKSTAKTKNCSVRGP